MKNGLEIDKYVDKYWWKNDLLHNENGHALEFISGYKFWYINGKLHRLDDPAIEYISGNKDGPAIEYISGYKVWYYKGQQINCKSQKEFETYIKRLVLL